MELTETLVTLGGFIVVLGLLVFLTLDLRSEKNKPFTPLEPWKATWAEFGIFFGVLLATLVISQDLVFYLLKGSKGLSPLWQTLIPAATMHLALISAILLGLHYSPLTFPPRDGLFQKPSHQGIRAGLFLFFAGLPVVWITALFWGLIQTGWHKLGFPIDTPPQELITILRDADSLAPFLLLAFVAVVLAPISEELIFRAGVYRFLKGKIHPLAALTVSSLLFALLHFNTSSFLPLFVLGLLFGRAYERSGTLLAPILFHACFNLTSIILVRLVPDMPAEPISLLSLFR